MVRGVLNQNPARDPARDFGRDDKRDGRPFINLPQNFNIPADQSRSWCFTVNDLPYGAGGGGGEPDLDECWAPLARGLEEEGHVVYAVGGLERAPTTLHWHIQGYVRFNRPTRFNRVRELLGNAHIEPAKGTSMQNRRYCIKDGNYKEMGLAPQSEQGKRTDISEAAALIVSGKRMRDVADMFPCAYIKYHRGFAALAARLEAPSPNRDMDVRVHWGVTGSGKTWDALAECEGKSWACVTFTGGTPWMDGVTEDTEVLVVDEFVYANLPVTVFLRLTDIYPLRMQIKGGFVTCNFTRVVFTSNEDPAQWYCNDVIRYAAVQRRIKTVKHYPVAFAPNA